MGCSRVSDAQSIRREKSNQQAFRFCYKIQFISRKDIFFSGLNEREK